MTEYPIDMQLVVDPQNPENIVRDGQVWIYDPTDTAGTAPLALKDPSGLPLPNPLTSNAFGFLPAFISPAPQVRWASGGFENFFNSYTGLRDDALAARSAAETARAAAEAAETAAESAQAAAAASAAAAAVDAVAAGGIAVTQDPAGPGLYVVKPSGQPAIPHRLIGVGSDLFLPASVEVADANLPDTSNAAAMAGKSNTGHTHTKADVGLSDVDNTSDAAKPLSSAATTALAGKSNTGHTHTKADVGLTNVDNTSDAAKPLSSAATTALAGKAATSHTHAAATTSADGFLAAADKAKLDSVAAIYTFEDGTLGGVTSQAGTAAVRTPEAHSGSYSVELTANGTTSDALLIFPEMPVQEGRTYRMSAWVKLGTGTGHQARWSGTMIKADNSAVFITIQPTFPTLSASGYTRVTYDWTIPAVGAGVPGYKGFKPRVTTFNARVVGYSVFVDDVTIADITEVIALATATAAGAMPAADKAKLDAATAAPTAGTVMLRDAAGRAQTATPAAAADIARKDYVDNINSGGYKAFIQADQPTAYPIGVTQFLGENASPGLWQPWPGVTTSFASICTVRDKTYTGGALQTAVPYADDTLPLAYRIFKNGAADWSAWKFHATQDYVDTRTPLSVKDFGAKGDGVTDDGAKIQNAVNAATAQGRKLFWPPGTYLKTVNITGFHTVAHRGPGVVKQGTDLFYVEPTGIQANTLYVATSTASDTFDGIARANALRTTNKAIDVLPNYGPVLQGLWAIQLDVGTYSDRVTCPEGLDAVGPITIRGPIVNHPNVPTALYKEGYNIGAVAFDFTDAKASFVISNIKFEGYNGTSSSAGIKSSSSEGTFYLINCHFVDNFWGTTNQSGAMDIKGGIFTRNGFLGDTANNVAMSSRNGNGGGYRGLMGSKHSIGLQDAGVRTNGPYFYFNRSGIFAQETCTGHADWCVFEDNDFGINVNVNSRVNADGCSFKRDNVGIRLTGNSHAYITVDTIFGTGVDEVKIPISTAQGSQVTDDNRLFTNISQSYNTVMRIADTVFPKQVIQATSSTVAYTATLGAGLWRDSINSIHERKRITVKVIGELLGAAGTKTVLVRLGANTLSHTFSASEVGVFDAEATIYFTDNAKQVAYFKAGRHLGSSGERKASTGATDWTNALTSNTNLTLEASVAVATDTVRVDVVDMSWG